MTKMCFDFEEKNVLITGAESRIGLEIAKGFARCGANIIIAGITDEEFANAERAIKQENAKGRRSAGNGRNGFILCK